jgi:phosphatidylserine/phosphatidylglycerophosphate/cardiolipin synthase-like enzyme
MTGNDLLGLFGGTQPTTAVVSSPGSGGTWWQVYFTDPHNHGNPDQIAGSIEEDLIERVNQAQKTIHIAAFEFNLTPLADALIAAHKRGVEVEWVTDDENGIEADSEDGHGQFAMLRKAGISVKDDGRSALMHNKFIIFDGQVVWTGATNLTENGIFENNNNAIAIESSALATIYEREFNEMWNGDFGPTSPSTVNQQSLTIEGTPIQVYFASEDDVINHLLPLIRGAKKSIRFMAFSFTNDDMGDAVLERAQAGVDVKGIFETRGSETEGSEMPHLYCSGVTVRQDGNPRTYHHKVIVNDGKIVVTGSLNFSDNANESNDENVIVLTHAEIANQFLQEFDRTWAEATPPEASDMDCK